jgi:hypothetical protein
MRFHSLETEKRIFKSWIDQRFFLFQCIWTSWKVRYPCKRAPPCSKNLIELFSLFNYMGKFSYWSKNFESPFFFCIRKTVGKFLLSLGERDTSFYSAFILNSHICISRWPTRKLKFWLVPSHIGSGNSGNKPRLKRI